MLYSVKVTNALEADLTMVLSRPETSGLIVRDIQGLGPVKSNINLRDNVGVNGSTFNTSRTPYRNIVLTLEFLSQPTIEASRRRTYQYFPTEGEVTLNFETDAGLFYITGIVESNEPNIFSEAEGTVISILCPDPDFLTPNGIVVGNLSNIAGLFSFPFSNEGETADTILGSLVFQSTEFHILFEGTSIVGPKLVLSAVGGAVEDPKINFYDISGNSVSMEFIFTTNLPALADGDRLEIVGQRPNRSVRRYLADPEEPYINYIGALSLDSKWPSLRQGDNIFSYEAEAGAEYIRISYEYPIRYTGI